MVRNKLYACVFGENTHMQVTNSLKNAEGKQLFKIPHQVTPVPSKQNKGVCPMTTVRVPLSRDMSSAVFCVFEWLGNTGEPN